MFSCLQEMETASDDTANGGPAVLAVPYTRPDEPPTGLAAADDSGEPIVGVPYESPDEGLPYMTPEEPPTGSAASLASEGMENTTAAAAAAVPQDKEEIVQMMRDELSKHVNAVSLCAELPTLVTCLCPPPGSELYEQKRNSSGSCEWLLHNIVRGGIDLSDKHRWTEGCIRWTMRFDEVAGRYDETSITKIGETFVLNRRMRHEHGHAVRVIPDKDHLQTGLNVGTIQVNIAWLESPDEFLRPTPAQLGIATFERWYQKTATSTAFTQAAPMVAEFLNDCNYAKSSEECNVMLTTTILPFQRRCDTSSIMVMEAYTTRAVKEDEELMWPYTVSDEKQPVHNEVTDMLHATVDDKSYADQRKLSLDEFVHSVPTIWQSQLRMIVSDYMGPTADINPVVHRQANWRLRCDANLGGGRLHVALKTSNHSEQLKHVSGTESWLYPQLEVDSDTIAVKDVDDSPVTNHMSSATRQRGVFAKKHVQPGTRVAVMCGVPVNTVLLFSLVAVCGMNAIVKASPLSAEAAVKAYFKTSQRAFPNKLNEVLRGIIGLSHAARSNDIFDLLAHWESLLIMVNADIFDDCIDRMANDADLLVGDSTSIVQKSIMQMYNRVVRAEDGLHQFILLPGGYISRQNMQMLQYFLYGIQQTQGDDGELVKQIEDATTWRYKDTVYSPSVWLRSGLQTHKTPTQDALNSFYEQPIGFNYPTDMLRNRLCVVRVAQEPLPASQKVDFLRMAAAMQAAVAVAGVPLNPLFIRQAGIVMMITASAEYSNTYQLFSTTVEVLRAGAGGDKRAAKSPQTVTSTMKMVFDAFFTKHIREFEFQAFRWLLAATRVDLYKRSYAVLLSEFSAELSARFVITRIVEWTVQTATGSKSQTLCVLSTDLGTHADEILSSGDVQFVANPESRCFRLDEIVKLLSSSKYMTATDPSMLPYVGNIGARRATFSTTPGVLQRFEFARHDSSDDIEIATAALGQYVFNLLKIYRENAFLERKYHAAAVAVQQVVDKQLEVSYDNVPLRQWSMSNKQFAQKFENYRIWSKEYDVNVVVGDDVTTLVIHGPDAGRTANLDRKHRQMWNWVVRHARATAPNKTTALKDLVAWKLLNKSKAQNSSTVRGIASDLLEKKLLSGSDIDWLKIQFARNDYETAQERHEQGRLKPEKIVAPTLPTSLDGRWQKAQASCMPWSQRDENAADAARGDATSMPAFCRRPAVAYTVDKSPPSELRRPVKRPRTDSGASATPALPFDIDTQLPTFGSNGSATPFDLDIALPAFGSELADIPIGDEGLGSAQAATIDDSTAATIGNLEKANADFDTLGFDF